MRVCGNKMLLVATAQVKELTCTTVSLKLRRTATADQKPLHIQFTTISAYLSIGITEALGACDKLLISSYGKKDIR